MQRSGWQAAAILAAIMLFMLVPTSLVERLPSVCLNHLLFGWCPGCGSVRALSRFFHGDLAGAVRFNANVIITAPLLATMLALRLRRP